MQALRDYINDQAAAPEFTSRLLHEASHMAVAEATTWGILLKWIDRQVFGNVWPLVAYREEFRADERSKSISRFLIETPKRRHDSEFMRLMLNGMPLRKKLLFPVAYIQTRRLTRELKDLLLIREFLWGDPKLEWLPDIRDGWVRAQRNLRHKATKGMLKKYRTMAEPAFLVASKDKETPERSKGFAPAALSMLWNRPESFSAAADCSSREGFFAPQISLSNASGTRSRSITGVIVYENLATLAGMFAQLLQDREISILTEGAENYIGVTNYLLAKVGKAPIHETDLTKIQSVEEFLEHFAFPLALLLVALSPSVLPAGGNPFDIQAKGIWNVPPHHLHPGWRLVLLAETADKHPEFRKELQRLGVNDTRKITGLANHFSRALGEFTPSELLMAHYMSPLITMRNEVAFPNDPLFMSSESFSAEIFFDTQMDAVNHVLAAQSGLKRISHVICSDGVLEIGEEAEQYKEAFLAEAVLRRHVYGTFPPHDIIDEAIGHFLSSASGNPVSNPQSS
jgi:hypothetical protein